MFIAIFLIGLVMQDEGWDPNTTGFAQFFLSRKGPQKMGLVF